MSGDPDRSDIKSNSSRNINILNFLLRMLGCLIGGILLYSALTHLMNPYDFAFRILEYQLLNPDTVPAFAAFLTFFQLVLATTLIWDIARQGTWFLITVLFVMFAGAQLISLLRGLKIDCGCFGYFSHQVSWWSFLGTLTCAIVSFVGFHGLENRSIFYETKKTGNSV